MEAHNPTSLRYENCLLHTNHSSTKVPRKGLTFKQTSELISLLSVYTSETNQKEIRGWKTKFKNISVITFYFQLALPHTVAYIKLQTQHAGLIEVDSTCTLGNYIEELTLEIHFKTRKSHL